MPYFGLPVIKFPHWGGCWWACGIPKITFNGAKPSIMGSAWMQRGVCRPRGHHPAEPQGLMSPSLPVKESGRSGRPTTTTGANLGVETRS